MPLPLPGFRQIEAPLPGRVNTIGRLICLEKPTLLPKRRPQWKSLRSSAGVSLFVHAFILLVLSWIYFDLPTHDILDSIFSVMMAENESEGDEIEFDLPNVAEPEMNFEAEVPPENLADANDMADDPEPMEAMEQVALNPLTIPRTESSNNEKAILPPTKSPSSNATSKSKANASKATSGSEGEVQVDHFVGRGPESRAALVKRMGGSDASEAAVGRGLIWLKNHQLPDGSWNFNHLMNARCDCTMPGMQANNPYAATAMALLAFLGAGQTSESGDYQDEVRRGIEFLLDSGRPAPKGIYYFGDLQRQPTFYTQGLVTIALSEAYAMTHDQRLRPAVSGAVEFLVATQHEKGGWRYFVGQPGDTSVVAWELMALKSAQFSRITVPNKVFHGIDRFLGSVASARGSQYAYRPEQKSAPSPAMTAAGTLCRMYLDWKDNNPALKASIHYLAAEGPSMDDMYYNYYATQVLHHWGGPEWDRWNVVMRDHLVRTQVRNGHAAGSWDVADFHGNAGGRLYMTSLAMLTLEVYYRHLPLYQKERLEIPLAKNAEKPKAAE